MHGHQPPEPHILQRRKTTPGRDSNPRPKISLSPTELPGDIKRAGINPAQVENDRLLIMEVSDYISGRRDGVAGHRIAESDMSIASSTLDGRI